MIEAKNEKAAQSLQVYQSLYIKVQAVSARSISPVSLPPIWIVQMGWWREASQARINQA